MPPRLNRRRALFVTTKIDEILAWEQRKEGERDTKCGFREYPPTVPLRTGELETF
jgi:hypothetical protein